MHFLPSKLAVPLSASADVSRRRHCDVKEASEIDPAPCQLYSVDFVQCVKTTRLIMSLQFEIVKDPWLLHSDRKALYPYEIQSR